MRANSAEELLAVTQLFREYAASLPIDLEYQDFERELSGLPGKYAEPAGVILLARSDNHDALGCVALRALNAKGSCEMKRLYVRPEARALGIGPALCERLIAFARSAGYAQMYLDTLPEMNAARALYSKFGFEPTSAYYDTPIAGTVFLRLRLQGK